MINDFRYSLGVLIYEMLTGLPPYFNKDPKTILKNIIYNKLEIPEDLSSKCRSLLHGLLHKDPTKRIGTNNGAEEILRHPWFNSVTLKRIEQGKLKSYSPYLKRLPEIIEKEVDRKNFKALNKRYQKQIQCILKV